MMQFKMTLGWPSTALFISILLVFSQNTVAHPGYYGTAFHAHTIEQATSTAAQEHKLVFIYVGEDDRGWRLFRWPTAGNRELIDLLVRESVIVELTIHDDFDQLAQFDVSKPGIIVLDEKSDVVARLDTTTLPETVMHRLQTLVTSKSGFARIERVIQSDRNTLFNLERKAAALTLANRDDEAVAI